ncbi:MAG TPA: hypothetical protein VHE35_21630 [Kofleriaceae bacterium]|nr:hypothetical protein [Kofleriaceae bacterium]
MIGHGDSGFVASAQNAMEPTPWAAEGFYPPAGSDVSNVQHFDDGSSLTTYADGHTSATSAPADPYHGPEPTPWAAEGFYPSQSEAPTVQHFDDGSTLTTYPDGHTSATPEVYTAPDRGDYAPGAQGDQQFLHDYQQYNADRLATGQNTVGPNGQEQAGPYEAAGAFPGAQQFGADHDYQAAEAQLQYDANHGYLDAATQPLGFSSYTLANGVTAAAGWLTTTVTAPGIDLYNWATGSNVNPAAAGASVTQGIWGLFGYSVSGSGGGLPH